MPIIQEHTSDMAEEIGTEDDELGGIDSSDAQQLASALIRALLNDEWLETFGDRVGLVTALPDTAS